MSIAKNAKTMEHRIAIQQILRDIMKEGGCNLVAFNGAGKTNAMQVLVSEAMKLPNTTVYIFDDCLNWVHDFSKIGYYEVNDSFVTEDYSDTYIEKSDFFVRTERGYTVGHGAELEYLLDSEQHVLFDVSIKDIDRYGFFCYSIIEYIYDKQRIRKKHYGKNLPHTYLFAIEEMQNLFETRNTNKRVFNRMRKIYSTARNFKIAFVGTMQRLSDVSTKITERNNYLIGKTVGDNGILKLYRILRAYPEKRRQLMKSDVGSFLYYNGKDAQVVKFPLFQQIGKPYQITIETPQKPQKQPILERILRIFKR